MAANFVLRSMMVEKLPNIEEPCVFRGVARDWEPTKFTLDKWEQFLGPEARKFRVGVRPEFSVDIEPELEPDAVYARMSFRQFRAFIAGQTPCLESSPRNGGSPGEGSLGLDSRRNWAYFDYKHLPDIFDGDRAPELTRSVCWDFMGHPNRGAQHSTLWIGTKGAHTAGHFDTYGYNLVAQLQGQKLWVLFGPNEGVNYLKPSRVPFEESSVYSRLRISPMRGSDLSTLLEHHPDYKRMVTAGIEPRVVVMNPGDVLYVPSKWWHFVSSCSDEPTVSLNTWVELDADNEARLLESATRLLVYALSQKYFFGDGSNRPGTNVETVLFNHESPLTDVNFKDSLAILMACKDRAKDSKNESRDNQQSSSTAVTQTTASSDDSEKLFFHRVESSGGWKRLVEILTVAFPVTEDGPRPLSAEDVFLAVGDVNHESNAFPSFLRAVTHPKTILTLIDVLMNDS